MDMEKLIKDIERQISEPTNEFVVLWFSEAEYVLELLKEQKAIVRCKDCIWFHKPDAETKKSCKCNYHGCKTKEDRYCWWGEKDA